MLNWVMSTGEFSFALDRALQGHGAGEGLVGDEHAGGVGGYVVDGALEALGVLEELLGLGVGLDGVLEVLAAGQRLVQGGGFQRYHPGDAVHVGIGPFPWPGPRP